MKNKDPYVYYNTDRDDSDEYGNNSDEVPEDIIKDMNL